MKIKLLPILLMLAMLLASFSANAFYNPTAGRWINRDPIGERGGKNHYEITQNDCVNLIDLFGLAPIQADPSAWDVSMDNDHYGPGRGPNGKTWLEVNITIEDVSIRNGDENALGPQCRCCVSSATFSYIIHIRWSSAFASTLIHETQHGLANEQLAFTALPYAIDYLKSKDNCKTRIKAWTRIDCIRAQQSEADAAAGAVVAFTNGEMNDQAHSFFGEYSSDWNPLGVDPYFQWLSGWLDQTFPAPARKFW